MALQWALIWRWQRALTCAGEWLETGWERRRRRDVGAHPFIDDRGAGGGVGIRWLVVLVVDARCGLKLDAGGGGGKEGGE